MDKKNLIQIILLIFLILITYSIFNNYYKKNNTSFKSSKKIELQDATKYHQVIAKILLKILSIPQITTMEIFLKFSLNMVSQALKLAT